MEHIIVEQIDNVYVKISPEKGYVLHNKKDDADYSEAIIKNRFANNKYWIAVEVRG